MYLGHPCWELGGPLRRGKLQACSRSGMAQTPVVIGRRGVAWLRSPLLVTHVLMVCPCMSAGPVQHEASQFSECP